MVLRSFSHEPLFFSIFWGHCTKLCWQDLCFKTKDVAAQSVLHSTFLRCINPVVRRHSWIDPFIFSVNIKTDDKLNAKFADVFPSSQRNLATFLLPASTQGSNLVGSSPPQELQIIKTDEYAVVDPTSNSRFNLTPLKLRPPSYVAHRLSTFYFVPPLLAALPTGYNPIQWVPLHAADWRKATGVGTGKSSTKINQEHEVFHVDSVNSGVGWKFCVKFCVPTPSEAMVTPSTKKIKIPTKMLSFPCQVLDREEGGAVYGSRLRQLEEVEMRQQIRVQLSTPTYDGASGFFPGGNLFRNQHRETKKEAGCMLLRSMFIGRAL
ncbi:hypothetical protein C8R44DRAFT_850849 [Mycena epipterygia]|nr:hypothetical protein C8R44DRAFT_850849 [Mycena epipterygia]